MVNPFLCFDAIIFALTFCVCECSVLGMDCVSDRTIVCGERCILTSGGLRSVRSWLFPRRSPVFWMRGDGEDFVF